MLHCRLEQGEPLAEFIARQPDVVLDLSLGASVDAQGPGIAAAGLPYIVGATGYQPATLERLRLAAEHSGAPVLIVPNFSLGANLLLRFAASAAKLMQTAGDHGAASQRAKPMPPAARRASRRNASPTRAAGRRLLSPRRIQPRRGLTSSRRACWAEWSMAWPMHSVRGDGLPGGAGGALLPAG